MFNERQKRTVRRQIMELYLITDNKNTTQLTAIDKLMAKVEYLLTHINTDVFHVLAAMSILVNKVRILNRSPSVDKNVDILLWIRVVTAKM